MDYARLVEVYTILERTPSRLKKVETMATLLADTPPALLPTATRLAQGMVFPSWSEKELGIAQQLMVKVIAQVSGFPEAEVLAKFSKKGDLGLVIEELSAQRRQRTLLSRRLTVEKVTENLQHAAMVEGKGAVERKLALVAELLSLASPAEAKYICRTTLGTLRVGVAEGVVRDAIAKAFLADVVWDPENIAELVRQSRHATFLVQEGLLESLCEQGKIAGREATEFRRRNHIEERPLGDLVRGDWKKERSSILLADQQTGAGLKQSITDAVELAWFLRPDFGEIAQISRERGLEGLRSVGLEPGKPYHVLLSEKAPSLAEALKAYEHPVLEWKYDGARLVVHKSGERIWLYTRRLENVTEQFPEVAGWARQAIRARAAIVEGEMIGYRGGGPLPFQQLSQRIKRKYDIEKTSREVPVQVNLFDVVFLEGKNLFATPLRERWGTLRSILRPLPGKFQLAKRLETTDLAEAESFYRGALEASQEGVIVKNLDAHYQPGRRVGFWLKVKPTMESLDLAIIGATWGTGKRTGWMGSFVLGCRDPDSGRFLACGMIGTGIKEKAGEGVTFEHLTQLLKPSVEQEKGNEVTITPRVVVEVAYEEIQASPTYAAGYALRFPRVVRIRDDKSAEQADTRERLERLFKMQFGKKGT